MSFENSRTRLTNLANELRHDGPAGAIFAKTLDEAVVEFDGINAECDATLNR